MRVLLLVLVFLVMATSALASPPRPARAFDTLWCWQLKVQYTLKLGWQAKHWKCNLGSWDPYAKEWTYRVWVDEVKGSRVYHDYVILFTDFATKNWTRVPHGYPETGGLKG